MPRPRAQQVTESKAGSLYRKLLTERQAADWLNISPRTLQAWRVRGGGPPFLKFGASVRYCPDDLSRWVEEQTRLNTTADASV